MLLVVAAYLLGAVPFGLLIGLSRGIDIRQHGSRNIGATNVGRVLGRKIGFVCLALDLLKGLAPTLAAAFVLPVRESGAAGLLVWLAVALAAVLGHVFPVYLRFRGGKGVATTIGVALGIFPYFTLAMLAALAAYAVARYATGAVSVGSLVLAAVFPIATFACVQLGGLPLGHAWPLLATAVLLALLIFVRHRSNIARLLRGEELLIAPRSSDVEPPAVNPS